MLLEPLLAITRPSWGSSRGRAQRVLHTTDRCLRHIRPVPREVLCAWPGAHPGHAGARIRLTPWPARRDHAPPRTHRLAMLWPSVRSLAMLRGDDGRPSDGQRGCAAPPSTRRVCCVRARLQRVLSRANRHAGKRDVSVPVIADPPRGTGPCGDAVDTWVAAHA